MTITDNLLPQNLSSLSYLSSAVTRSISPENPTGEVGMGGLATEGTGKEPSRDLGTGWKVSPSIAVQPGETHTLADISGTGRITHIWATVHKDFWRSMILRAYWEGDTSPAVEVPIGDFFCQGWGVFSQVSSQVVAANPNGGFNSYWPMPFENAALITVENTSDTEAFLYYQVTYELGSFQVPQAHFHAQWRRTNPVPYKGTHTLLENVEGRGQYVGTYLAWGSNSRGWWGEGEIKFYLDSDTESPTICGTGTEDYFGGAWNFDVPPYGYTTFTTPYLGLNQVIRPDGLYDSQTRFGMYRWHIVDPIRFCDRIAKVDIQALGWRSKGRYLPLQDDLASTAFFYLDRTSTNGPGPMTADQMEIL